MLLDFNLINQTLGTKIRGYYRVPEYIILISFAIYYIALYTIVYYLLNNKYVKEMYKEGKL